MYLLSFIAIAILFAICSMMLMWFFPHQAFINSVAYPMELIHILLAFFALGILALALLQGILLILQNILLKRKYFPRFIVLFPPLEKMDQILFCLLIIGFILMTLVILSSVWFLPKFLGVTYLPHGILSLLMWVILAIILVGRYVIGFRGQATTRWTIAGMLALLIVFMVTFYF